MEKCDVVSVAERLNILEDFLAKRDLKELTQAALQEKYKIKQVDVLILFGGCIPEGCEVFYQAYRNNFAKHYMIVGGAGHTTASLRQKMQPVLPNFSTADKSEAEIMQAYLKQKYNMENCILESKSTNCGNNVTNALTKLDELNIKPQTIAFIQDATMQHRMEAGFRKYAGGVKLINFAGYKLYFTVKDNKLVLTDNNLWGMWSRDKYIELLLGEIPRLQDDKDGYGPNGKDFIAHVDIPAEVETAFRQLKEQLNIQTRKANEIFATK